MLETDLIIAAADDAARYIAFDVVDQLDDLLLAGTRLFELTIDDVVAEQLGCGFRRETVKVGDGFFQATIEFGFQAFAVGVPEGVMHRVGRDVMAHHERYRLLQKRRSIAGFLGVQFQNAGSFSGFVHARHCGQVAIDQSIEQLPGKRLAKGPQMRAFCMIY